ncbi:hypothetical protein NVV94_12145 [Pseudomonas sp. LS1212]|uniref:hypothetical protein n=1 Tax=Pseudomonas sp. LS1212 TaxID=2972478 RepID=UPI00215C8261|nr:hypothetical protein [Pseudomonas sp. LS1212]UVJ46215.1 hypothetical protein NVV94_12145 [Pseudomonas sp. LS1212]
MKLEDQLIVLAHTAYCAKFYIAFRGSLEKLIELIAYSIGEAAPDADQISVFIRKEETQRTLEVTYETALWRSADRTQSWRLICLAVTADPEVAKRLLAKRPPSPDCCAYCLQDERGVMEALKPELDIYNNPIPGVMLHRQCSRPWGLMRDLVARAKS